MALATSRLEELTSVCKRFQPSSPPLEEQPSSLFQRNSTILPELRKILLALDGVVGDVERQVSQDEMLQHASWILDDNEEVVVGRCFLTRSVRSRAVCPITCFPKPGKEQVAHISARRPLRGATVLLKGSSHLALNLHISNLSAD